MNYSIYFYTKYVDFYKTKICKNTKKIKKTFQKNQKNIQFKAKSLIFYM